MLCKDSFAGSIIVIRLGRKAVGRIELVRVIGSLPILHGEASASRFRDSFPSMLRQPLMWVESCIVAQSRSLAILCFSIPRECVGGSQPGVDGRASAQFVLGLSG